MINLRGSGSGTGGGILADESAGFMVDISVPTLSTGPLVVVAGMAGVTPFVFGFCGMLPEDVSTTYVVDEPVVPRYPTERVLGTADPPVVPTGGPTPPEIGLCDVLPEDVPVVDESVPPIPAAEDWLDITVSVVALAGVATPPGMPGILDVFTEDVLDACTWVDDESVPRFPTDVALGITVTLTVLAGGKTPPGIVFCAALPEGVIAEGVIPAIVEDLVPTFPADVELDMVITGGAKVPPARLCGVLPEVP